MAQSIGQQLRQAREARKLTLEQVAQATRIRLHYLRALEEDDEERLPSPVQARGFLRAYARFLDLDLESIAASDQEPAALTTPVSGEDAAASPVVLQAERAQAIFEELGARFRRQREILGLSLADVERHTRLRVRYLTAIEAGKIEDLPSTVQARGMISNYATFLGMDAESLLMLFAEGLQAGLAARRLARARLKPSKKRPAVSSWRNLIPIDLIVGGLLVLFIGGFVIWGALRIVGMQSERLPTVTAPSISDILAMSTATPSLTLTSTPPGANPAAGSNQEALPSTPDITAEPAQATSLPIFNPPAPTLTATLPPFALSAVQVYIVVRQRAWMRVVVDGEEEFAGRVFPGSAYLFSGKQRVEILTGNGAALNVYFNQVDQGVMGIFGEVVYRVYTPDGVLAPTPTITFTSTSTPTPATTATPTITPTETLAP